MLFLVWQKYQEGKLAYFSINYAKSVVRTKITDYVRAQKHQLDQTVPFRSRSIIPIGQANIQHELIAQPLEHRYVFLDAQSRVMSHLLPKELMVYDAIHEGLTREETCRKLKMGFHKYTYIREKIKKLFLEYL